MTKISNQYSLTNILTADLANSRLGINNVSPTVALDVTGAGKFSGALTAGGKIFTSTSVNDNIVEVINSDTTNGYGLYVRAGGTASGRYVARFKNGADADVMWLDKGGNVGIGTTSPADLLSLSGGQIGLSINSQTTGDAYIRFRIDGTIKTDMYVDRATDNFLIGPSVSSALILKTNTTERMRISAAGNVGIGVVPSAWGSGTTALQIGTTSSLWNRASDNLLVLVSNSYFNGSSDIQISTGTSNRMYFVSGGTYFERAASTAAGSGTPWTSSMVISANGSIGAPSGTNIYNASDARLKKNISTTNYGLDAISALNPVKFNWVDGFESTEDGKDMLGFIAQEVQAVLPEAIESFGGNSITIGDTVIDNPLRVNEKFIIPVLVKAIQELSAKVSLLENK